MHHKIYWTPEIESAFIELVAGRPRIWDPRDKDYVRRSARNEAFLEMGAELRERWPEHAQLFTHENMVNKFSMLRSYFRREWKTAQKIRSSSESAADYVPKWEHYARLSFLEKVPVRSSRNRSSCVTAMDISDHSEDSDATSPDTEELDCGERPGTSGPKFRLNLRPFLAEEGPSHRRLKQYQSSDDSSNEDFPPSMSNHSLRDIIRQEPAVGHHLSAADVQRKNALDLAFCRYLNTMLSPIPDCLQKELAKIKITETILKLKFPQA